MRLGKYLSSLTKPELDEIEKICNFTEDAIFIFHAFFPSHVRISAATIFLYYRQAFI